MAITIGNAQNIKNVVLTDCMLTLEEFIAVAKFGARVTFGEQMKRAVNDNRALLEQFLAEGRVIYGVTTGFGENVRYTISPDDAETLQANIVRTHAVAVGEPLDREQTRAVMLMTILNAGKVMSVGFEKAYLMQTSLNISTSEIISTYVYKMGLKSNQYSYSAAIGLFNNLVNFILLLIVNGIAKKMGDTSLF